MIYNNGSNWVLPKYKITRTVITYDDSPDLYPDGTAEEVVLTDEQKARFEEIKYNTGMTVEEAETYVMEGIGEIPDDRSEVDKLIEKIIELDPDSPETKDLVKDVTKTWVPGENYGRFVYVKFDGVVYKTIHPIRGQVDMMTPPEAPHLYTRIGAENEDGTIAIEEWRQPTGTHDAYKIGDRVIHNGKTWEVVAGNADGLNSWEPGVYGWVVVD